MLGSARPAAVLVGIVLTATMLTAPGAEAGRSAAPAERVAKALTPGVIDDAPNPGAVYTGSGWVVATTRAGTAGRAFVGATRADEGWRRVGGTLLTRMPRWARTDKSLWAPSMARRTDGSFLMFYSAVVRGTSLNRCIGTAWSNDRATGPFTPHDRPLVCYAGSGTRPRATIPRLNPTFKLIDPTPTRLGNQWVLTFKTGYKSGQWRTTTRMLGLGGSNLLTVTRKPVTLTHTVDRYIEENPVIVKHAGTFTLFTSFGFYGQCRYWTRYRQNRTLWSGWQRRLVRRLDTPGTTCGSGNAHVVQAPDRQWLIFFNGHGERTATGSPDQLYIGRLRWHDGQPRVPRLIR